MLIWERPGVLHGERWNTPTPNPQPPNPKQTTDRVPSCSSRPTSRTSAIRCETVYLRETGRDHFADTRGM